MNILHRYTLKSLARNRVRTLVTIIGIVLSVAMLTAVTTSITSLQNYLLSITIASDGAWHGRVMGLDKAGVDALLAEEGVSETALLYHLGYAKLDDVKNDTKPYLFLGGMNEAFPQMMPVHLIEGRLPQVEGEVLVPSHLAALYPEYAVGTTFALTVGDRMLNGVRLTQIDGYSVEETFENGQLAIFTVVGVYYKASFERSSAPGYTLLTVANDTSRPADAYVTMHRPGDAYDLVEKSPYAEYRTAVNTDYMMAIGQSRSSSFRSVLYGMGSILILIIVFGSVSLIYNSFSISLSERTKQFGILSSVGATRRQMRRSVLFEALFLSCIGIPVGVGSGVLGIGLTLRFLEKPFLTMVGPDLANPVKLTLHTSWQALVIAALLGLVTVLVSAALPARRALRIPVIEAIRQTRDIRISPRKVRTSKLTLSLFGIEGVLASKNFKRSKKQYRATVVSLFVSVVLFISASSFSQYTMMSASDVLDRADFDLCYELRQYELVEREDWAELFTALSRVSGVTKSAYSYEYVGEIAVPADKVNSKTQGLEDLFSEENGVYNVVGYVLFIDDVNFLSFLEQAKLDPAAYRNPEQPKSVALDFIRYQGADGRFRTFRLLQSGGFAMEVRGFQEPEGYTLKEVVDGENGESLYVYESLADGSEKTFTNDELWHTFTAEIADVAKEAPFSVSPNYYGLTILYPFSALETVIGGPDSAEGTLRMYFNAENHRKAYNEMLTVLSSMGYRTSGLSNYAASVEAMRSLVLILNVFSYGFIALISLIAMANVFNTISTNIALRRREFAMLKSIGVTDKGFQRMMNYECLLYGFKGLMYGIPAALGLTYLMFRSVSSGWAVAFMLPWKSIVISVASVFAVVFATMLYAMGKIKKDNPIDALKNENL